MQEFHVFLKQFCHADLTTSYFLNADHKQHNIIIRLKSTLLGATLNWSDEERERLFIPTLVGYIPETCLAVQTRNWKMVFFLLPVQREMPRQLQFWLLQEQIAGGM